MKQVLLCISILLFTCCLNAQDEIDSTTWELVIPIEINTSRSQIGTIVKLDRKSFFSLPASFDDPSRLLTKYPGFANSNDQNNSIIYHGMPGHMSGWTLYGAEILNPNHLGNAGNINNKFAQSSGGVNVFSGQVIGEYNYRANPDIHTSNDYLAGVSDIKLRTPYKDQFVFNTSLIGLESGLDLKKEKFDLLINARYSTIGVLSGLGLDFGDEEINYNDVVAKLGINIKNGTLDFYSLIGSSQNYKEGLPIDAIMNIEDDTAIDLDNTYLVSGFNFTKELAHGLIEHTTNYSREDLYNRYGSIYYDRYFEEIIQRSMISSNSSYTQSFDKTDIEVNYRFKNYGGTLSGNYLGGLNTIELHQPGIFFSFNPNFQWKLNAGLSYYINNQLDKNYINPSLGISYLSKDFYQQISFKYAANNQMMVIPSFNIKGITMYTNPRGHHFDLSYKNNLINISTSLFYHFIDQIQQDRSFIQSYSLFDDLNAVDIFCCPETLSSAHIFGLNLAWDKQINDHSSIKLNGSFIESVQLLDASQSTFFAEDISHRIPYGIGFNTNLIYQHQGFLKENLDLSLSINYRDGKKIKGDGSGSQEYYTTSYKDFFRMDARLNYLFTKRKFKSFLSLDIQNVLNTKNVHTQFYDQFVGTLVDSYQLGFLPILSWRVVL